MTKKKNKTFAQRAKDIVKGYKRADFDPIEKAALESKLEALKMEQESTGKPNYACGGKMYNDGGILGANSSPEEIQAFQNFAGITADGIWGPQTQKAFNTQGLNYAENLSSYTPTRIESTVPTSVTEDTLATPSTAAAPDDVTYSPYSTSIAPSLISGATSALGNLYLANQQRNTANVNLPRISAPEISLERGRQAAQREATRAGQRIKYATKAGARTRGELMANRAAAEAAVSGQLGETLSASHEKEALVNANMEAGMDKYNAEMAAKEEMINNANKIKDKEAREAYLAAAIGTIPQMTRDINATRAQDRMINILGEDYGWYMEEDPNAKWYQKRKTPGIHYREKTVNANELAKANKAKDKKKR